jgi:hypothetical protein
MSGNTSSNLRALRLEAIRLETAHQWHALEVIMDRIAALERQEARLLRAA